jgi:hypothetical protein
MGGLALHCLVYHARAYPAETRAIVTQRECVSSFPPY